MTTLNRKILCVDDDDDDLLFLTESIQKIDPSLEIVELNDGIKAVEYLASAKERHELPCLVLLDINMPLLDGRETLKQIRTHLSLHDLHVIILTSSKNPNDALFFSQQGIEMYTKPVDIDELDRLVKGFLSICE